MQKKAIENIRKQNEASGEKLIRQVQLIWKEAD